MESVYKLPISFLGWNEPENGDAEEFEILEEGKKRWRRQAEGYELSPSKTRCPLLLVADYRFFTEMGAGNTKTTINYLVLSPFFYFHLLKSTTF